MAPGLRRGEVLPAIKATCGLAPDRCYRPMGR
jgi:hypothetical protein